MQSSRHIENEKDKKGLIADLYLALVLRDPTFLLLQMLGIQLLFDQDLARAQIEVRHKFFLPYWRRLDLRRIDLLTTAPRSLVC